MSSFDAPGVQAQDPDDTVLRSAIDRRTEGTFASAGIDPHHVQTSFERTGPRLLVGLTGPPVGDTVRQALGVRVLEALGSVGRTFGQVDVLYSTREGDRRG